MNGIDPYHPDLILNCPNFSAGLRGIILQGPYAQAVRGAGYHLNFDGSNSRTAGLISFCDFGPYKDMACGRFSALQLSFKHRALLPDIRIASDALSHPMKNMGILHWTSGCALIYGFLLLLRHHQQSVCI